MTWIVDCSHTTLPVGLLRAAFAAGTSGPKPRAVTTNDLLVEMTPDEIMTVFGSTIHSGGRKYVVIVMPDGFTDAMGNTNIATVDVVSQIVVLCQYGMVLVGKMFERINVVV